MTNQLAFLARRDYFYLDAFWCVNLGMYIIICEIEGATIKYYYFLTSTYSVLRVCPSDVFRILSGIWLSIFRWPEAGRLGGQQKTRK